MTEKILLVIASAIILWAAYFGCAVHTECRGEMAHIGIIRSMMD